jgi:hypothetical protein
VVSGPGALPLSPRDGELDPNCLTVISMFFSERDRGVAGAGTDPSCPDRTPPFQWLRSRPPFRCSLALGSLGTGRADAFSWVEAQYQGRRRPHSTYWRHAVITQLLCISSIRPAPPPAACCFDAVPEHRAVTVLQ